jgi:hypothetical protein
MAPASGQVAGGIGGALASALSTAGALGGAIATALGQGTAAPGTAAPAPDKRRRSARLAAHVAEPAEPPFQATIPGKGVELGLNLTYQQAMDRPDADRWRAAMEEELAALERHRVWTLAELPPGRTALPAKWVLVTKPAEGGGVRYKARLVAKGFMQVEGRDYTDVYAPVSKHATLRALLAKAAREDLHLRQLDVKTAFLNGDLEEEIYLQQPDGFQDDTGRVYKLHKSLYGLKQAPRAWARKLADQLLGLGFEPSEADPALYVRYASDGTIWLLVYVDDMLLMGHDTAILDAAAKAIGQVFDCRDLGEPTVFIGLEIERNWAAGTIKVHQRTLTADLVRRYGLLDCRPSSTPLPPGTVLSAATRPSPREGYGSLIGSLLYLAVCTRPDIAHAVGVLARYSACAADEHWAAARAVLRYLSGTVHLGLTYSKAREPMFGYCDADYGGDKGTSKSTTGYAFILSGAAVAWSSRLQQVVAVSTAEAEYMAAKAAVQEALWLKLLSLELQQPVPCMSIKCDNQAALMMLKNPMITARAKHIAIHYHFARERVARGEVQFEFVQSNNNAADCLTKALPADAFKKCRLLLGMLD